MKNTNILDKIKSDLNSSDVLNYYLRPYHDKGTLKAGQHISNPFLEQKQQTPSFNIYQNSKGDWRYKDFATEDDGDCIELVKRLFKLDFNEAVRKIAMDFNLDISDSSGRQFDIRFRQWETKYLEFWQSYGILKEVLERYEVAPVQYYKRQLKNGKELHIQARDEEPIYAYKIHDSCYKVYSPVGEKYKFSWLGKKPQSYIFGWKQLPDKGDAVYITGGEKDVLALAAKNKSAISLNSETASPSEAMMNQLKSRFKNVVILYDLDETGMRQSKNIAENYGVQRMLLPDKLKEAGGKDIADFFRLEFAWDDGDLKLEDYRIKTTYQFVPTLLNTRQQLTLRKAQNIEETPPILTHCDNPVFYPRTINIIQGKTGVHKSRLAETFCSAFIKKPSSAYSLLGFKSKIDTQFKVCYVDTERNLTEQFPIALQQILKKAGYNKEDTPSNFDYISLLEVRRKERFKALGEYLSFLRDEFDGHLVMILDVITDCIKDFNSSEDTMELIDLMNNLIKQYNVTFIAIIHENPGSTDKARGHLGTELWNKTTTTLQLSFEKGKDGEPSDLIALKFLKKRNTKRYDTIYLKYCDDVKGLVMAESDEITEVKHSRFEKARMDEVQSFLTEHLIGAISSKQLVKMLTNKFDCSDRIIRDRLREICERENTLPNHLNQVCILTKMRTGKETFYELSTLNDATEQTEK